ncbi:zeta toxin family protein [Streptomyces sp. NPDC056529]|uniref:zeta toxin family protein n=1 Tax=Streptomyces sp. NPDC056529 TaxID=3345855 RepID=UPI0036933C28
MSLVVAGQPGAGKTTFADLVQAALARRGGAVRVCRDLYKNAHPHYAAALAADIRTAGTSVRPDTSRWQVSVEEYVRACRFDAVVESALADAGEFRVSAAAYRRSGHRIELVVVATAEAWARLGTLDRFLDGAADGGGARFVGWDNLDVCVVGLPVTLAVVEAERLADRVTVVRRDGTVLYDNKLAGGVWRRRVAVDRAVAYELRRPWNAPETAVFHQALARAEVRVHRDLPEDERLTVHRDARRAAALAEPVRRIAQARRRAPGVDYHRLSAAEHARVFDELTAPSCLSGIVGRDDPRAVYVLGQPGAGKLLAARMVRRAMRPGTTHLIGDNLKAQHPDYLRLLGEDPRRAGAAIRHDYRAWFTRAEQYVRERRGDVLIEGASGSVQEFLTSALPFAAAGYAVDLVILAVREADSLLSTACTTPAPCSGAATRASPRARATTCASTRSPTSPPPPRRTRRSRPSPSSAATATPWYATRTAPVPAGRRGRRPPNACAPTYTEEGATAFLRLYQGLRRALPRHRDELEDTLALARPLLPPGMRPAPLARPHPAPRLLPVPLRRRAVYDSLSSFSRAA